jgi:predicted unusual protein kinase regulating ubiquinone biosynthesis (AarF/ABC1/UbiB family)
MPMTVDATVRRVPSRKTVVAGVVAAFGAAAATYLAVKRAGEKQASRQATPLTSTTRAARTADVARLGTKAGGTYAVHRARRAFASAERKEQLDVELQLRTAEQVAEALGHMKGALMKVGQMASYLDQGLPEPIREQLAQLQADAPPMAPELAAEVVERELGAPPEQIFETWDPVPFAAASIGQVHRAITRDGRAVAVKVQYPGVDEAINADLANAGLLVQIIGMVFPGVEPEPIVEELKLRLREELDYVLEAKNQRLFEAYYRDHPFISIPPVVDELSSRRVLTTELAEGARFDELLTWSQIEKDLAAEAIYRFVFGSLYRLSAFNGDPHPGNYLFNPGGRVTFLDFGLVKHFTSQEVTLLANLSETFAVEKDMRKFRAAIAESGFLRDASKFSDEQITDYFEHFWKFVLEDAELTTTPEWSSESVRRFFDPTGEHGDIMRAANVPGSFVILQRINLGLVAVLGELHATRNWRRIAMEQWPFVNGPPSTPLGVEEAEWLKQQSTAKT